MKSLPRNVTTNAIAQATVTIIDNDSECWNNLYVFELQAIRPGKINLQFIVTARMEF